MALVVFLLSAALVLEQKGRRSALFGLKIAGTLPGPDVIKHPGKVYHSQMLPE